MNNVTKILLGILAIVLLIAIFLPRNEVKQLGSIADGMAYNATTTDYTWLAGSPQGKVIKTGNGTLGSIIIGNATAVGTITLYDATTTSHLDHATTTLAVINTGTLSGTYTFDVAFTRGLLAVPSLTIATSTITWR